MNIKNDIIKKLQKITPKKITENSLISDLKIDSLDLVELVVDIEKQYNVSIPDEKLNSIKTINDIFVVFENEINSK